MSEVSECNNMAVLSVVGALVDQLAASGLINGAELAERIDHAASAQSEAGRSDVADTIRWIARALTDDQVLGRLTVDERSSSH